MMDKLQPLILIAEDEPKIASILSDYLSASNLRTLFCDDGAEVIASVKRESPALLLLDLMLPNKDGMTICRELRAISDIPIIIITAKVEEIDRLLGLELGADDYICKPFSPREVVARVKTILRRIHRAASEDESTPALEIDNYRYCASVNGRALDLTPVEFRLISTLAEQPGRVFSRGQLLDQLYDDFRDVSDRTIDSHIKNLRRKIDSVLPNQQVVISVYGVGYKLEFPET